MSDERNVICRCGLEMKLRKGQTLVACDDGTTYMPSILGLRCCAYYQCDCGWTSPKRYGETESAAIEAAYAAATRRPPNRPLTRKQVMKLDDLDAVWILHDASEYTVGMNLIEQQPGDSAKDLIRIFAREKCKQTFAVFACKPTPADIEAARKESE